MRSASFCSCEERALRRPSRASALGGRGSVFGMVAREVEGLGLGTDLGDAVADAGEVVRDGGFE